MLLLFKKKFYDAIRSGRKRQTIRMWKRCMVRAGQTSYIPHVGRVLITAVDAITLDQITEGDAILDGFASREQLMAELRALYGEGIGDGRQCYKILFDFPAPEEPTPQPKQKNGEGL